MLITLKNLQQQTFTIDIDPSQTIKQLKERIQTEKGKEYPSENQRLIYAGAYKTPSGENTPKMGGKRWDVAPITKIDAR